MDLKADIPRGTDVVLARCGYDTEKKKEAERFSGICFPAHIDRDSYSVLSVLGEIAPECGFTTAELADISLLPQLLQRHPILGEMNIVTDSDAHYLENMREAENTMELEELTAE